MKKMNDMYLNEFLHFKHNRVEDEQQAEADEARRRALKEYVNEIEMREVINRKVFKLKCQTVYGESASSLDFNCHDSC